MRRPNLPFYLFPCYLIGDSGNDNDNVTDNEHVFDEYEVILVLLVLATVFSYRTPMTAHATRGAKKDGPFISSSSS